MRGVFLKPHYYENRINLQGEVKLQYFSKDLNYLMTVMDEERRGLLVKRARRYIQQNTGVEFWNLLKKEIHHVLGSLLNDEIYFLIAKDLGGYQIFGDDCLVEHWCVGVCKINEMHLKAVVKERRILENLRGIYVLDEAKDACYNLRLLNNVLHNRQGVWIIPDENYSGGELDLNCEIDYSNLDIMVHEIHDAKFFWHKGSNVLSSRYKRYSASNKRYRSRNMTSNYIMLYSTCDNKRNWKYRSKVYVKDMNLRRYLYPVKGNGCHVVNLFDDNSLSEYLFSSYISSRLGQKFDNLHFYGFGELFRV
jgi:hypothetical protein